DHQRRPSPAAARHPRGGGKVCEYRVLSARIRQLLPRGRHGNDMDQRVDHHASGAEPVAESAPGELLKPKRTTHYCATMSAPRTDSPPPSSHILTTVSYSWFRPGLALVGAYARREARPTKRLQSHRGSSRTPTVTPASGANMMNSDSSSPGNGSKQDVREH